MNNKLKQGYLRENLPKTKRYCQSLKLKPETIDQYLHWHRSNNIWKEIPQGIRRAGILDMEIYIAGDTGFMIIETAPDFDFDTSFDLLATYERQAEWEDFVAIFQETEKSKRSVEKWQLVERIFSLVDALEQ